MSREVGLYLHIPFCVRKCAYCDFPSFAGRERDIPAYAERVKEEIAEKSKEDVVISTLYIGGGTPSHLPPEIMETLLRALRGAFSFREDAECTCECNPGTVTRRFLDVLRRCGVNRISMGAQASQPRLLSMLGRIHTWEQVRDSAALIRDAGFDDLNLDLMLGLPGQTPDDVRETLAAALALSPTHLSCYGLIVEDGTPLQKQVESGAWSLPPEEDEREEYECCRETLAAHGFEQYEISNFALPGHACRHNLDCWRRKEYIGIGSSACGFMGDIRYQNPPALSDYLRGVPPEITRITPEDARFESMMLGLRTMEGVREEEFLRMHGMTMEQAFGAKLLKPLREGLIRWQDGRVFLTRKGMDLQNRVLVELL